MAAQSAVSVNHYLCPHDEGLETFLDRLNAHGFMRVGLTERAFTEAGSAEAVMEALARRKMSASSVNSAGFFLAEGEDARRQGARNRELIRWTKAMDGAVLNVIVGGSATLPLPAARSRAADALGRLAADAAEAGVGIVVEPLHVLNIRGKSCLNTIHQAEDLFELLQRRGIRNVALNLDFFHLWWDPDLDSLLEGRSVPVGLFQVCDAAQEAGASPRRVPPGEGQADWRGALEAVRRTFPDCAVELELFRDQLPGRDIDEILAAARTALTTQTGA